MPELAAPAAPAPAAAPSSPAPAAPALSAPASPAPGSPAAPDTPGAPPAAPDSGAAPAPAGSPAAPVVGAEPRIEDFGDDVEGFAKARWKWEREQDAQGDNKPAPEVAPAGDKPEDKEAQPGDQSADVAELQDLPDEPESLTPESLNTLITGNDALKTALEADPNAKGALFAMARQNAKLKDLGEIFPNKEAAQFAAETASRTTDIKTAFLRAEQDPSQIGDAFDKFVDEFTVYENGKPKLDAAGNPVLGKDFEMLAQHMTDNRMDGSIAHAEQRIASGQLSEKQRENYEAYVQALKFIKAFDSTSEVDMERPDVGSMDEESRKYFEKRDAELKKREEETGLRTKEQNSQAAKQERRAHEIKVAGSINQAFGTRLSEMVKESLAQNINIPEWALKVPADPNNPKVSIFLNTVYNQFIQKTVGRFDKETKKWIGGQSKVRNDLAQLELLGPTEDAARQRIEYFTQLREDYLPAIYDAEVRQFQKTDRGRRQTATAQTDKFRNNVQPDVRGGAARQPAPMTAESARAQAEKNIDAKYPDLDAADREEKVISESFRLQRQAK